MRIAFPLVLVALCLAACAASPVKKPVPVMAPIEDGGGPGDHADHRKTTPPVVVDDVKKHIDQIQTDVDDLHKKQVERESQ